MLTVLSRFPLDPRGLGAGIVSGIGLSLTMFYFSLVYSGQSSFGGAIEGPLLLILSLSLAFSGSWLLWSKYDAFKIFRTAAWSVIGFVSLVLISQWILALQSTQGLSMARSTTITLNVATIGATSGLLLGLHETRLQRQPNLSEFAEGSQTEDRVVFLVRILRHHLLNGMSIIRGYTDLAIEQQETPSPELRKIQQQSDAVIRIIRNIETLGRAFTNDFDPTPIDLSHVIESGISTTQAAGSPIIFEGSIPAGYTVWGGEPLATAFETLFQYMVERSNDETPCVYLTTDTQPAADTITVRIVANSPQQTFHSQARQFDPGAYGDEELNLYLVQTILDVYGGELRIEPVDAGAAYFVQLPRAIQ